MTEDLTEIHKEVDENEEKAVSGTDVDDRPCGGL